MHLGIGVGFGRGGQAWKGRHGRAGVEGQAWEGRHGRAAMGGQAWDADYRALLRRLLAPCSGHARPGPRTAPGTRPPALP